MLPFTWIRIAVKSIVPEPLECIPLEHVQMVATRRRASQLAGLAVGIWSSNREQVHRGC